MFRHRDSGDGSISATRRPSALARSAAARPAGPQPTTVRSKRFWCEEGVSGGSVCECASAPFAAPLNDGAAGGDDDDDDDDDDDAAVVVVVVSSPGGSDSAARARCRAAARVSFSGARRRLVARPPATTTRRVVVDMDVGAAAPTNDARVAASLDARADRRATTRRPRDPDATFARAKAAAGATQPACVAISRRRALANMRPRYQDNVEEISHLAR